MDIVLIAGLWLDGSVWKEVASALENLGHRPVPVMLPGQTRHGQPFDGQRLDGQPLDGQPRPGSALHGRGDGSEHVTLDEQVTAVLAAVDSASGPSVVVGHSAACTLAWLAADARPERVAKVVLVGGFPTTDGRPYADFFELTDGVMPFPGWGAFEGPDAADLDEEARRRIAAEAIPVPGGVAKGIVRLTDERRFDVPTVVLCPEFTPDQAREWIAAGDVPELAKAKHVEFVNIDSGHWPMVTKPVELAALLAAAADA